MRNLDVLASWLPRTRITRIGILLGWLPLLTTNPTFAQVPTTEHPQRLAYDTIDYPGGTFAYFEGWGVRLLSSDAGTIAYETVPPQSGGEMTIRVMIGSIPLNDQQQAQFIARDQQLLRQTGARLQCIEQTDNKTPRGYQASWRTHQGLVMGQPTMFRQVYLRDQHGFMGIHATATPAGYVKYPQALDILVKQTVFRPSTLKAGLAGLWTFETSNAAPGAHGSRDIVTAFSGRKLTIYPNGLYVDRQRSGVIAPNLPTDISPVQQKAAFGWVSTDQQTVTFHEASGKKWSATYQPRGDNALLRSGRIVFIKK